MQCWQEVAPFSENVSTGQSVQREAPGPLKVPAGQGAQLLVYFTPLTSIRRIRMGLKLKVLRSECPSAIETPDQIKRCFPLASSIFFDTQSPREVRSRNTCFFSGDESAVSRLHSADTAEKMNVSPDSGNWYSNSTLPL